MKKNKVNFVFQLSTLATSIMLAGGAQAQEIDPDRLEAIAALTKPQSEVRVGGAYLSDDGRRIGQYSGVRDEGGYGLLDVNFVDLDKATGTWARLYGRNLGLDNREAAFELARQGQWKVAVGFSQTPRYEPYIVNTAVSGLGSERLTVPTTTATALTPVDLSLKRDLFSALAETGLGKEHLIRLRYTHETKEGARLYGRGTIGTGGNPASTTNAGAIEFLTEPNDRTTETWEAAWIFQGKTFQVSAGYNGSLFVNHGEKLDVVGGNLRLSDPTSTAAAPNAPFTPMSQPLSNDAHQLFATAGYNITPLTRVSLKVSETMARQNENFISVAPASTYPGAPASLNGRVDTTLAYLDLTSVEFDRIDLQANIRYEDRDDKTPEAKYMSGYLDGVGASLPSQTYSGSTGYNKPRSWSSMKYKLEGGYQLPENFKLTGGWDYEQQKRESPELFRKVNFREELNENTYRLELKRSIFDTLSGALSASHSRRDGSDYLPDTYDMNGATAGTPPSNLVNPLLFADRKRDAWKLTADWIPFDNTTVHAVYEQADDAYSGRLLGPREGSRAFASIDASYAISDRWSGHVWWSMDDNQSVQQQMVNPVNPPANLRGQLWQANIRQASEGVGAGMNGRFRNGVEIGADASYSKQSAEYRMQALSGTNPVTSLPDYFYRMTELKLFASVPVDKQSGVRFDYRYFDWKTDDWTWANWTYTDGTTVTQDSTQHAHLIGATYYYRWQ